MATMQMGFVTSNASNRGVNQQQNGGVPVATERAMVPATPLGSPRRDDGDRSDLSTFICSEDQLSTIAGVPPWPPASTLQDLLTSLHDYQCAPRPANGAFLDVVNYGTAFYLRYGPHMTELLGDVPACGLYEYVWGSVHDMLRRMARAALSDDGAVKGVPPVRCDLSKPPHIMIGKAACYGATSAVRKTACEALAQSHVRETIKLPPPSLVLPGLYGGSRPRTVDLYSTLWSLWSPGTLLEVLSSTKCRFYEWVLSSPVLAVSKVCVDLSARVHVQSLAYAGVHEFAFGLVDGSTARVVVCLGDTAGSLLLPFELPNEMLCNSCLSVSSHCPVSMFPQCGRVHHSHLLATPIPHAATCQVNRLTRKRDSDIAIEDLAPPKKKAARQFVAHLSSTENEGTSGVVNVMPVAELAASELSQREKNLLVKALKQYLLGVHPTDEVIAPNHLAGELGFDYLRANGQVNFATPIFDAADWPNPASTTNPNLPSFHPFRVVNDSYPNLTEGLIMTNCSDGSWLLGVIMLWRGNRGATTIGSTSILADTWAEGQLSVDYGINQTIFVPVARFAPAMRNNNMVAYIPLNTSIAAQLAVSTVYAQLVVGGAVVESPTGVAGFNSLGLNSVNPQYWPVTASHIVSGTLRNPITERSGEASALSSATLSSPCSVNALSTNTTAIPIVSSSGEYINNGLSFPGQNGSLTPFTDTNFTTLQQFNNGQPGSGQAATRGVPTVVFSFSRNGSLVAGAENGSFVQPLSVTSGGTGKGLGKNMAICEFFGSTPTVTPTVSGMVGPGYGFVSSFVGVPIRVVGQVVYTSDLATSFPGVVTDLTKLTAFLRVYTPQIRPDDATWSIAANFRDIPVACFLQNQGAGTPAVIDSTGGPATYSTTRTQHNISIDVTFVPLAPVQRIVLFMPGTVAGVPIPPRAGVGANGVTVDANVRVEAYGDAPPRVVRRDVGVVPGSRVVGSVELLAIGFRHPAILNTETQKPIVINPVINNVAAQLAKALMAATSHVVFKKSIEEHDEWRKHIEKTIDNASKYEAGWADMLNTILRTASSVMSGLVPHTTHQPVTLDTFTRRRKAGFVDDEPVILEELARANARLSGDDVLSTLAETKRRRIPSRVIAPDPTDLELTIAAWNESHDPLTPEELSQAMSLLIDGSPSDIRSAFAAVRYPKHAGGFALFPTIDAGVPASVDEAVRLSSVFGVSVEPVETSRVADASWRERHKFFIDVVSNGEAKATGRHDGGFEPTAEEAVEYSTRGLVFAAPYGLKEDVEFGIEDVVDYLSIVRGVRGLYELKFTMPNGAVWLDYRSLAGKSFMAALIAATCSHHLDRPITGGFQIMSPLVSSDRAELKLSIQSSLIFDKYDETSLLVKSTNDDIAGGVRQIFLLTSDHPGADVTSVLREVNADGVRVTPVSLRDIITHRRLAGRGKKNKEKVEVVAKVELDPPTQGSTSRQSRRARKRLNKQVVVEERHEPAASKPQTALLSMKDVRRLMVATFKAAIKYLNSGPSQE